MQSSSVGGSVSINNLMDTHMIDDYVKGSRGEKGQLSPVRRFFCLYVTFDLLFTTLLWIICIVLSGREIFPAFEFEIAKYNVKSSLFDTVMLAGGRFIILLLFYALLHINHWWAVAVTTAASSGILIAKVFLFEWDNAKNTIFVVLLILVSFILAWGEAWFLDFRVFPREIKARLIEEKLCRHTSETAPLLGPNRRYTGGDNEDRAFYSPIQSPAGSDDDEIHEELASSQRLGVQEFEYKRRGREALDHALKILQSDQWRLLKTSPEGDTTYIKTDHSKQGSVFKLMALIDASQAKLMEIIWHHTETAPSWNPTVICCKILQKIDSHTDISYHITAEAGGGLITSRDFVAVRHWQVHGDVYVTAGISIEYPAMPPQESYVRGENGPCAFVLATDRSDPEKCHVTWLLSMDLKGWIPQYLIDQAVAGTMLEFVKNLRKHIRQGGEEFA